MVYLVSLVSSVEEVLIYQSLFSCIMMHWKITDLRK